MALNITTRAGKGAPLTNDELDANFIGLRDRVASEALPEIAQTIHVGNVIKSLLYDTSRDSDGGAWRKRCAHTSWFTEAINQVWLGQVASELLARGDNWFLAPESLLGGAYSGNNITSAENAAMAPDGTVTMPKIQASAVSGQHYIGTVPMASTAGLSCSHSVYAKAGEETLLTLSISGASANCATFDLAAGTITSAVGVSATITPSLFGSYRCAIAGAPAFNQGMYMHLRAMSTVFTGTGNGGLYVWGMKSKIGALTPYVSNSAMAGNYYQNTTDGKFYALNAAAGQTEVFRGNVREFPAQVAIVAESTRVVMYDLTQPSMPMWMNFTIGGSNWMRLGTPSCMVMLNGELLVGSTSLDLVRINFISEVGILYASARYKFLGNVSLRNSSLGFLVVVGNTIASRNVYALAAGVLDGAPVNPLTGLPIPTYAVGCVTGATVMKADDTVATLTVTINVIGDVAIIGDRLLLTIAANTQRYVSEYSISMLTSHITYALDSPDAPRLAMYLPNGVPALQSKAVTGGLIPIGREVMLTYGPAGMDITSRNPGSQANGMTAFVTASFNSGWMVGNIKGAYLADIISETLNGAELVSNGSFGTDTSGWTPASGSSSLSVVAGAMRVTQISIGAAAITPVNCVIGKLYTASISLVTDAMTGSNFFRVTSSVIQAGQVIELGISALGNYTIDFVATQTTHYISIAGSSQGLNGEYFDIDNVSCRLADPDRSVNAQGLSVFGAIEKRPVAPGAQLAKYYGFGLSNYLHQAYNSRFDFGTGDFSVSAWFNANALHDGCIFERGGPATSVRFLVRLMFNGAILFYTQDAGAVIASVTTGANAYVATTWNKVEVCRKGTEHSVYLNGLLLSSSVQTALNVSDATGIIRVGIYKINNAPFAGALSLVRIGGTAPSPEQIMQSYQDELQLFNPGANCTLAGGSSSVMAASYDTVSDNLQVGTDLGYRSVFKGLLRVGSEYMGPTIGAYSSISANGTAVLSSGSTSSRYYQPAMLLRDELRRRDEARKALGKIPTPIWFTGDGVTMGFTVTPGYDPKFVYKQGLLMRDGVGNDYTLATDGYKWAVSFAVAPLNNHNICVMGVRNA